MSKMILSMMVSLDGMIAGADGDLDWFRTDEEFEREMLGLLKSVDAFLFGRVAYQLLSGYWPTAGSSAEEAPGGFTSKQREIEFAGLMNSTPKVVFSRTLERAEWGPARIVKDDVAGEVARMKRQAKKDLVLFAGAGIAATFMNMDLIDEYRLMVHPIALGEGVPLFGGLEQVRALELASARALPSGVVRQIYRRDRSATG
jgi:dihydrofolate reductase